MMESLFYILCVLALMVTVPCSVVTAIAALRMAYGEFPKKERKRRETREEKNERKMQEERERIFNEGMASIFGYDIQKARGGKDE